MKTAALFVSVLASLALQSGSIAVAREPQWKAMPQDKARIVASKFAACVVQKRRSEVIEALAMPVGNAAATQRLAEISDWQCLGEPMATEPSEMHQSALVLRGYLYQALLKRDFKRAVPLPPSPFPVLTYPVETGAVVGTMSHDYRALMRIGECAVRHAPAASVTMVTSPVASKAEASELTKFDSTWSVCLPKGFTAKFSPDVIRGSIAEPLYRALGVAPMAFLTGTN